MNLDKLDEALNNSPHPWDGSHFEAIYEAARAFRDQERAKRPRVDFNILISEMHLCPTGLEALKTSYNGFSNHEQVATLLDVLRTEVVPALERAADDRKPGIYSSESLKLLTALGLR